MSSQDKTPPEATGSSSVDLPPEMLEMILKNLDQANMLNCRLINSQWKDVVDSLQEKKILSNWFHWNATIMADKDLFPVMPAVQVEYGVQLENLLYLPPSVVFEEGRNSFPNSSLCIEFRKPKKWYSNRKKLARLEKVPMDLFLVQHGHHLTSLALHEVNVTPAQLLAFLPKLQNLKALTLHEIKTGCSKEDGKEFLQENPLAAASSKLTHLRVFFCDHGVIQWLMDAFANQLIRLELDGKETSAIGEGNRNACGKLEQLSVHWPNKDFLMQSGKMPVKYLSLIDAHTDVEPEEVSMLKFLQNFSSTLEVLNLGPDFEIDYYCGDQDEWKESAVVFPKLKRLSVRVEEHYEENAEILKEGLLPKFPNLESLELQRFSWMLGWKTDRTIQIHAVEHIKQYNYFQVCPKLKCVAVTNLGRVRKREYYVTVDKQTYERMVPRVDYMEDSSSDDESSSDSSTSGMLTRLLFYGEASNSSDSDSDVSVGRRNPRVRRFNVGSSSDSD